MLWPIVFENLRESAKMLGAAPAGRKGLWLSGVRRDFDPTPSSRSHFFLDKLQDKSLDLATILMAILKSSLGTKEASANPMDVYRKAFNLASGYLCRNLLYCSWQVTYRCNFRCSFCHYWKMQTDAKEELTISDFGSGAQKLKNIGTMIVSLAGGEPMMRKDLPELVRVVSAYHFPFITTNGWLVTQNKAKQLFESGLMGVAVSIDFPEEKKHDENRGKEGAFRRTVQAVKYFVEAKSNRFRRVDITAVLLKENSDQIEELIILAKKLGAEFTLQPYSDLKTVKSEYDFSVDREVSKHLLELKRKYPNFKSSIEYLRRFD
jgi:MoaA/NifB/PqqE/SkfB family radical SAM enzyme